MASLQKEFPNSRLDFLLAHPSMGVIAALGSRTCIILSPTLDVIQRHLDTNRKEKLYCCEFADILDARTTANPETCNSPESLNGGAQEENAHAPNREASPPGPGIDGAPLMDNSAIFLGDFSIGPGVPELPDAGDRGPRNTRNLLLIAGESGIIKIIDLQKGRLTGYLKGHTGAVHDLKAVGSILVSCSEDSTLRLWDLHSYSCIGVLGGLFGHKDHILSIDVDHWQERIVSVGTDASIKQWAVDFAAQGGSSFHRGNLIYKPAQSFVNVHRSAITKVAYYGNIIVSLCNNTVSAVYSNACLEKLKELNKENLDVGFLPDNPIFIGSVDFYGDCKTFIISRHVLLGLSSTGDVYLYDLRNLSEETTPYIIETKLGGAEDFVLMDEHVYISTGGSIHRLPLDMTRFDDPANY